MGFDESDERGLRDKRGGFDASDLGDLRGERAQAPQASLDPRVISQAARAPHVSRVISHVTRVISRVSRAPRVSHVVLSLISP